MSEIKNDWFSDSEKKILSAKDNPVLGKTDPKTISDTVKRPAFKASDWEGVGKGISNKLYHESDNLSASKLKVILSNAVKFRDMYVTKEANKRYTDALLVGSLHHTLVLEPENFDRDYIVLGVDNPVKQDFVEAIEKLGGQVERKENSKGDMVVVNTIPVLKEMMNELRDKESRTIVTKKQLELAQKTSVKALESWYILENKGEVILKNQLKDLLGLKTSHVERTFYGEINGVKFQIRPDLLMNLGKEEDIWFCLDLKTAEEATMEMFSKQSARFHYDLQEWIYCEILRQNGINVVDFRFCVSGKSESSKTAYYKMDKEDILDAEKIAMRAILKYLYCFNNDIWEESRFDFENMKFDTCSTVRLPTYRKYQLIDMGIL